MKDRIPNQKSRTKKIIGFFGIPKKNRKGHWHQLRSQGMARFIDTLSKPKGKTIIIDSQQIN